MFKIIYNNIVLLIIFVVVMLVVSCDTVSRTEVTRIKSPDSIADAVLIKVNAGATASYAYEVYIIPTGGQPTQGNEIFHFNLNAVLNKGKFRKIIGQICNCFAVLSSS